MKALSAPPAPAPQGAVEPPGEGRARGLAGERHAAIWTALYFPRLVLESFDRADGIPFAVVEERGSRQWIHCACEIAASDGIVPGMPLTAAHALCHNLAVHLRDTRRETRILRRRAWRATGFTPTVSLSPPDCLLLEVSASLRFFGGLDSLREALADAFGGEVIARTAPTPAAARLLAINGQQDDVNRVADLKSALGEIPLDNCGLETKLVSRLAKCGLRSLRDLWRLPPADLARRFGPDLTGFLDRLCGAQADPRATYIADMRFRQQLELPVQTGDCRMLETAAEKLLQQARDFLQERSAVAASARLELHHVEQANRERHHSVLCARLQQPGREPHRFLVQIREQLGSLQLPAPVERVVLAIDQVIPWSGQHRDLFQHRQADQQAWVELAEALTARLGTHRVYILHDLPDHRPEKAWGNRPVVTAPGPQRTAGIRHPGALGKNMGGGMDNAPWRPQPPRPTWLLPAPRALARAPAASALDGETERIEAGWWDDADCRRDYRRIETRRGERWWIFRDLEAPPSEPPRWYLHGLFA